jgi:hypothetical protein
VISLYALYALYALYGHCLLILDFLISYAAFWRVRQFTWSVRQLRNRESQSRSGGSWQQAGRQSHGSLLHH